MNDLVERADLGMPKRRERGMFLALFVGFTKAPFDFRYRVRLEIVCPHLINHG
jgi:hypothetical protein